MSLLLVACAREPQRGDRVVESTVPPEELAAPPGGQLTGLMKRGDVLEFQVGVERRLRREELVRCEILGTGTAADTPGYLEVVMCDERTLGVRATATSIEAVEFEKGRTVRVLAGVARRAGEVRLGHYFRNTGWIPETKL